MSNLHDRLINKTILKVLLSDANDMRIARLLADPDAGFPKPVYIGRRPHWWHGEIIDWIENKAHLTKPVRRQGRPPTLKVRAAPQGNTIGRATPQGKRRARRRADYATPRG
jgi:hypothetical protein